MSKRVFRYHFDVLDGQADWLNQMAARGWRLERCHILSYEFEPCPPGAYEYAVEFAADMTASQSEGYRALLEGMGYRTWTKNLNANYSVGHVRWRPWVGVGRASISTTSGVGDTSRFNQELIIVERAAEGEPFQLHTGLKDRITAYRTLRRAYVWGAGMMAALGALTAVQTWRGACSLPLGAALLAAALIFGVLWGAPAAGLTRKLKELTEENRIHE